MHDPVAPDRSLVRAMLAGDEEAFERLFDTHFPGLYRFALRRLGGDAGSAEDVAQAAMCKGIRKIASWRGEASLFTWLCTICRREILDHVARTGRGARCVELVEDRPDVRAALESLGAAAEGPDDTLDRVELGRLVWVALDRLPAHYGHALEWKYLDELPVRGIAERLGLSEKAAESLLTRARIAFRDAFDALLAPDPARDPVPEGGS